MSIFVSRRGYQGMTTVRVAQFSTVYRGYLVIDARVLVGDLEFQDAIRSLAMSANALDPVLEFLTANYDVEHGRCRSLSRFVSGANFLGKEDW